jgi:hypothetical protein
MPLGLPVKRVAVLGKRRLPARPKLRPAVCGDGDAADREGLVAGLAGLVEEEDVDLPLPPMA